MSGSLPLAGRAGEGVKSGSMYRDPEQRNFARHLRNQSTEAEKGLWQFLRKETLGVKFRRQAAIGPYIVDFVCFSKRLIVELDGPQHLEPLALEHDKRRTTWLASRGFRVIRFRNDELDENMLRVMQEIRLALNQDGQPTSIHPP